MADFVPQPFGRLASRMFRELELKDAVFDLPRRAFYAGDPKKDFSVRFHGMTASSPLGPAAGPHTQLAQNIVLAWLGGARVFELKTVQIMDRLKIPRPCIDMRNVGYNVEWSQELRTEESLDEYVKASMLIDLLRASGKVPLAPGFERSVFDLSVGYDLKGVKSDKVRTFIAGMKDAAAVVARLRAELPEGLRRTEFLAKISGSVTLSTFHGCPPDEIEAIADFMMSELGLDCVIKL
ncbi:MAG: glutamate synthase, partial [Elusimicrobia bacterium]|nr:glutamate synthase [Elusimicrobiota bacterium]